MKRIQKLALGTAALVLISVNITMAADDSDAFLNELLGSDSELSDETLNEQDVADIESDTSAEETKTQTSEKNTQTATTTTPDSSSHGVSLNEPKVDLQKKTDGNYLDVKWDVDSSYRPMIFVTKDGKQIFGDTADKANIKLPETGTYKMSFQVRQDGEYVEAFNKSLENKAVDTKAMSKVKVGPAENFIFGSIILMSFLYFGYRLRVYNMSK